MAEFVLNRNHMLHGMGHGIKFVKGQPTWVPECLHREAIGIGAEPTEGKIEINDPEEAEEIQLSQSDKDDLFFRAFETLIARNEREDFGGDGKPSVEALKKILNFGFTKKERDVAILKFRAMKAAEVE